MLSHWVTLEPNARAAESRISPLFTKSKKEKELKKITLCQPKKFNEIGNKIVHLQIIQVSL